MKRAWNPWKYVAVYRISLQNQWAYVMELLVRSVFLVVIMYVFSQLWSTTFHATHNTMIHGYGVGTVVWYLAVTESIVMGSPRLTQQLSEEIKQGDIAYRLTKPIGYIAYNYAQYVGEATVRVAVNFVLAGLIAAIFFGPPPMTWTSVLIGTLVTLLALSTNFAMNMVICLLLFWMEDGRGLQLILSRLVMILGGMMIPLPLFPKWLADVCQWLPFQVVAYLPARTLVEPQGTSTWMSVAIAMGWLTITLTGCTLLYRKGVRQLHVQGG